MLTLPNCVVVQKLGRGSYGEVYLAKLKSSEKLIAVKCIPKTKLNKRGQDNLISEISILQDLRHPNVIRLLNFTWDSARVYLFMEYCAGGDLSQYIRLKRRLPEPLVRRFLRQLALALQYLHRKNIIHMDLKPQNILLTSRTNPVLKVSDFGLAQCHAETVQKNELRGTLLYMAPEVYCEGRYYASCDLWSVGVILYECLFGSAPYASYDSGTLREKLLHDQAIQLPSHTAISADCAALLKGLLQRNPKKRLTHEDFFSHPFVDLEHVPSAESLDKALEFLEHALDLEKRGNLKEAHEHYTRGLSNLLAAVEYETSSEERVELRQLALWYFQQAEKVKSRLDTQKAASHDRPARPRNPLLSFVSQDGPRTSLSNDGNLNISKHVIQPIQVAVGGGSPTRPQPPPQMTDPPGSSASDAPSTFWGKNLLNKVLQFIRSRPTSSSEELNPDDHASSVPPDASHSTETIKPIAQITEEDLSSLDLTPPPRPPPPATFGTAGTQGSNGGSKKADHSSRNSRKCSLPAKSQSLDAGTEAHKAKHPSCSISRESDFSLPEGSVPASSTLPSRSVTASDKLARLRQMTTDFATKNDAVKSTMIDTSLTTLPEIPAPQMSLVYDMDRLRALKALCHTKDAPLLALVEHLENFYTLFRSNDYERSLRYVQTNFGTFLSVTKGDTNEVRRRKFMKELKLVLDLMESCPQSNTETPPQPIQTRSSNPHAPHGLATVSDQELDVGNSENYDMILEIALSSCEHSGMKLFPGSSGLSDLEYADDVLLIEDADLQTDQCHLS